VSQRVLLVEDDELVRGLTSMILRGFGHEVVVTASADEALAAVAQGDESIDVLFSDVKLGGGMTGVELARQMLKTVPTLRVILTSGDPSWLETLGLPPAQVRLLSKPFRRDQVKQALDGLASATTAVTKPSSH
jgi:CheY-like chemotaxis protein